MEAPIQPNLFVIGVHHFDLVLQGFHFEMFRLQFQHV
jgi:hypothetical protein